MTSPYLHCNVGESVKREIEEAALQRGVTLKDLVLTATLREIRGNRTCPHCMGKGTVPDEGNEG